VREAEWNLKDLLKLYEGVRINPGSKEEKVISAPKKLKQS